MYRVSNSSFIWCLIIGFLLSPFSLQAMENPWYTSTFPKDFRFQSKPVDPGCISQLLMGEPNQFSPVKLSSCNTESQMDGVNKSFLEKGFVGYNYALKITDDYTERGYKYYKHLGAFDNLHVIYAMQNNGGSGFFTSILLIKKDNDIIQLIAQPAVGDRCNRGIEEVTLNNNLISYKINITPFDFLEFSNHKYKTIKPYDDLAACAICCVGKALFQYNIKTKKSELISIEWNEVSENMLNQGKYQECFNKLQLKYIKEGKKTLLPKDIQEFVKTFITNCQKNK